jgi:hypothetical protein
VHGLEVHDAFHAAAYPWFPTPVIAGVTVLLCAASGYLVTNLRGRFHDN